MSNQLEKVYKFTLPENISGVTIIFGGTGGTGGHAVPHVARTVASKILTEGANALPVEMLLFDRDVVEFKNITRQNFYHNDIGKVKSETLAKKVTNAFQIPVKAYPKYIEEPSEVVQMINEAAMKGYLPIFVGCFDNPQPRKVFHDGIHAATSKAIWIDAGNNEFDGQVILSAVNGRNLEDLERKNESSGFFNLPTICEIDTKTYLGPLTKTSEISCAEHTVSDPQAMCANTTAAQGISVIISNLLTGKGYKDREMRFNTESTFWVHNIPITISNVNEIKRKHAETVNDFKNGTTTL